MLRAIITAGLLLTAPIAVAPVANADPNWDAIAQCESGGNWHINTGNGYQGGLQWSSGTWNANRDPDAPASAAAASREQQIAAANRLYAKSGLRSWPVCGARG